MANEKNLKPYQKGRSKEEAAKSGRMGGIASGKARRERKTAREFAEAALNAEVTDKSTGKKVVVKDVIVQKLIARAVQDNDLNTVKYIFELIGEAPSQKVEVTGKDGKDLFTGKTDEELDKEIAELQRKLN